MLKVPTIADRAWQCLAKYALEPAHEATFHERSYVFRTGRSAHDAQKILFSNLSNKVNGIDKRVIELDIEKCFDRINHSAIMDNLIAPAGLKLGIFRCLKAGTNVGFPEQGTPQGGVVSPLLANIALNGIESLHKSRDKCGRINEPSIRYADDMVIILKPEDDARWMGRGTPYTSFKSGHLRCLTRKRKRIATPAKHNWIKNSQKFPTPNRSMSMSSAIRCS